MKTELELLAPERAPAIFREKSLSATTSASATIPGLGTVQVADELGFAYLSGDIDFGAIGRNEIHQNIKYIVLTEFFSVPLDREFGMDYSMVDKPMAIAEAIFAQEVAMKIALYEPRAQFRSIDYVRDEMIGKLSPSVKVVLLTTEELPRSLPVTGTSAAVLPAPTIATAFDFPSFYEWLITLSKTPGPPGPEGEIGPVGPEGDTGPIGPAGAPGENAFTLTAATFDVPAVGATVDVTVADASWIVVGQMVVVETAGGSPTSAYSLKVTAKVGNVVTLLNPVPSSVLLNPPFTTLTDVATITWTMSPAQVTQNGVVTLGGNRTLAFSGIAPGMNGTLIVKQDATGSRTLALPSGSKVINGGTGAVVLTMTASAIDLLTWIYDGVNYWWTYGKNYN